MGWHDSHHRDKRQLQYGRANTGSMPDRIPRPCRAGHPALTRQGYSPSATRGLGQVRHSPSATLGLGGAGSKLCDYQNDCARPALFLCMQFEKFRPSVARWSLRPACQAAGVEPVFAVTGSTQNTIQPGGTSIDGGGLPYQGVSSRAAGGTFMTVGTSGHLPTYSPQNYPLISLPTS